MLDHRGPEFGKVVDDVVAGVKRVFETDNDLLVYTASGSGGLESAVANLVSPGDKVVVGIAGSFGERFAGIAAAYGCEVVRLEVEWGLPLEPADLAAVLAAHPDAGVVLITHNETSASITNPLPELARVVREADRVLVVDGVSSVGSMPIRVDELGIDVAITGSQKGLMAPPGLVFVTVSGRAWERSRTATSPRFYWDWKAVKDAQADSSTPFTPAISVFHAVQEGIRLLEEEGLANVYERHRRIADAVAASLPAIGFRLLGAEGYRSAVVTGAFPPDGTDVTAYRSLLRTKYGVIIGGGQGRMKGRIIRVGHLGAVTEGDMAQVLFAMEQALEDLDIRPNEGRAAATLAAALAQGATPAAV
jgi:aspartate aminotransferase-like enzyme